MARVRLVEAYPELLKQWHPIRNGELKFEDLTVGSSRTVWWKGKCGHEWQLLVWRAVKKPGCPYCQGYRVLEGLNDLATKYPDLALQWHPMKNLPLLPTQVFPNSHVKAWWLGECGHEWQAIIQSRVRGNGCPYCANRRTLTGFNDLATLYPDLVKEWSGENGALSPRDFLPGSHTKVFWDCPNGHTWRLAIRERVGGRRCNVCFPRTVGVSDVIKGVNDLGSVRPDIACEWHPTLNGNLTPAQVSSGTNTEVWWQCSKDERHYWRAPVKSRTLSRQDVASVRVILSWRG